jgi:hypothetical protein
MVPVVGRKEKKGSKKEEKKIAMNYSRDKPHTATFFNMRAGTRLPRVDFRFFPDKSTPIPRTSGLAFPFTDEFADPFRGCNREIALGFRVFDLEPTRFISG